jgi:hypothetical protein
VDARAGLQRGLSAPGSTAGSLRPEAPLQPPGTREGSHRGSASRETSLTWQSGTVRRRGKADNKRGRMRSGHPIGSQCANSMAARSPCSTQEAGYTTAADPLRPFSSPQSQTCGRSPYTRVGRRSWSVSL